MPYVINRMIAKKVNYRTVLKEKYSGKKIIIVLTPLDLRNAVRQYGSMSPSMMILNKEVLFANLDEGTAVDEITTNGTAEIHDDCVELHYIIDDSFIDIDEFFANLSKTMKSNMKASMITSPRKEFASLLTALKNTGKCLKYTYVGKNTGKTISIVLDREDINDLMIK